MAAAVESSRSKAAAAESSRTSAYSLESSRPPMLRHTASCYADELKIASDKNELDRKLADISMLTRQASAAKKAQSKWQRAGLDACLMLHLTDEALQEQSSMHVNVRQNLADQKLAGLGIGTEGSASSDFDLGHSIMGSAGGEDTNFAGMVSDAADACGTCASVSPTRKIEMSMVPERSPERSSEPMNAYSATKLLQNLWIMFEPLAVLQYMQNGYLARNLDLISTAKRFLEYPIRQFRANAAQSAEQGVSQTSRARIKRQHKLRKAWFGRLLLHEPGILDYFMTAELDALTGIATALDKLVDHIVLLDIEGHVTNLNKKDRSFHGLTYAPLMVDKYRGAFLEWMLLQITGRPGCTEDARVRAKDLAVMRQLLRRLQLEPNQKETVLDLESVRKQSMAQGTTASGPTRLVRDDDGGKGKLLSSIETGEDVLMPSP
eukprot:CAMPEP_0119344304 /NCGR_PEP_ID=MMETSP1333-20130426/106904_1 /TAXON_ID=418940 /ORGANISM="Scyphosphaera apsteinii, Strain RCC1455" /LENGTH=434 /DNA_ID=CAMNT_0007356741 /DNA_START=602 /DNA_END=1906 /DNA_ORIENTATION=-